MFDVGLLPLLSQRLGVIEPTPLQIDHPIELVMLSSKDPKRSQILETYLDKIQSAGFAKERQGIWLQSGDRS
ncbi:MAG: hypothetical protein HC810_02955 [Acaryochloridaceae cyanobacterium RL_2_7]|nr:hypothetical protein [Acaryochloridaceae cyanobacterium RL_2_7]